MKPKFVTVHFEWFPQSIWRELKRDARRAGVSIDFWLAKCLLKALAKEKALTVVAVDSNKPLKR